MNQSENEYDEIAEAYRDSKLLPFRKYIEEYTFFKTLGDIQGATVLDLACGEGFYTRKIKRAGAAEVTGVDLSAEMIKLAKKEERICPLGCKYLNRDVAKLDMAEFVDVVVAMYLLNYARTKEELLNLETYQWAFQKAGFFDFQWVGPFIHPSQQHNPFWDAFMSHPPLIGFSASKQG